MQEMIPAVIHLPAPEYKSEHVWTVNEYLQYTQPSDKRVTRGRMVCADGWTVSVQASFGHYCTPRVTNAAEYTEVELGYPSAPEPMLEEHREMGDSDVYPYVPVTLVDEVVAQHGGIVGCYLRFE